MDSNQITTYINSLKDEGFVHAGNVSCDNVLVMSYTKWINGKLVKISISRDNTKNIVIVTKNVRSDTGSDLGTMVLYNNDINIDFLQVCREDYDAAKQTAIAYSLVASAFSKVLDKGGRPYFEHCLAVCRKLGPYCTDELKQVAILHDYLEDIVGASRDSLLSNGFKHEVVEAVYLVSKLKERSEIYTNGVIDLEKYYACIMSNRMATLVKMADLRHNSDLRRLKGCTEKDLARSNKYITAYYELENHCKSKGWI